MRNTREIIILSIVLVSLANAASDVVVDKLKLFVDGKEFFIKAMCYNPVPLGTKYMDANGFQGGGFCSPKMTIHGEWKSACYDSDFFDGSSDDPQRDPQAPASWFKAIWQRDFPEMQATGANTLRIYNANPTTRQASEDPANNFTKPYGKDHIPFFDMAATYGFKVIFPLFGDYNYLINTPVEEFKQYLRWQIDEIGNHSALLMFTLGNELPLEGNQNLVQTVNTYMAYARTYMSTKWSRKIPLTTAVVDLPTSYKSLVKDLDVDVFTTNAGYRGFDFSDLWSSSTNGLYQLSCTYNKPVFIGEIGWMSMNGEVNALYPDWVNRIWKDLVNHIDAGCIGGAFFEYSNEIYTKADPLQQHMGIVSLEVDGDSDQPNVFKVDKVVHMPYLYDALIGGTYEGVAYNMNSDPFDLIGRDALTLSNAPEICSGFVTPTPKPTSSGAASTTGSRTTSMTITSTGGQGSSTGSSSTPSPPSSTTSSSSTPSPVSTRTPSSSTSAPTPSSSTSTPTPSSSTSTPTSSSSTSIPTPSSSTSTPTSSTSDPTSGTSSSTPSPVSTPVPDDTIPTHPEHDDSDSDAHPLEPVNFGSSLFSMCLSIPSLFLLLSVKMLL